MRRSGLVLLCTLALAATAATAAEARTTPKIRAQQAHARAVVAEINRIGRNLETVVQAYDGARWRLRLVQRNLRRNEYALRVARKNLRAARKQLLARLYSLYVNGRPDTLDLIAGATSISQMIDRAESAQMLSSQDAALGRQALRFAHAVHRREVRLHQLKRKRAATVLRLAAQRRQIQSALGRQKRLLASIHSSIAQLQAQERAREERLRQEAAVRLARQIAAQRVAAQAPSPTAAPVAASPSSTGIAPSPAPVPVGAPGSGHPEAAQIALRYLGVPYVWGGASPGGFDCSGLVMYVYAQLGISLPHYTVAQWSATLPISLPEIQPGDLVFFDGLGHVGIYIGNGQFVHAPHTGTVVQISPLSGYWASALVGARRVP